jgi:hypothetical protein
VSFIFSRLHRLLIAEKNFSTIDPLIRTCGDRRLDVDFDVCASTSSALGMLLANSYQLLISGAHLAEMEDFLLLRNIQALDPFVPFVVHSLVVLRLTTTKGWLSKV